MRWLITLRADVTAQPAQVTVPGYEPFETDCHMISRPNYPHLDDDLRNIVLLCTASDTARRPSLKWLCDAIVQNIAIKTAEWYAERSFPRADIESDNEIYRIMQHLFFNEGAV